MKDRGLSDVLERLQVLEKTYEIIRIVDPVKKHILSYVNGEVKEEPINCHDLWGKDHICYNCTSIRAFQDNETYIKLEYKDDNVYLLTSVPTELAGRNAVIELISNTRNNMLYSDNGTGNVIEVYTLIDNMNKLALRDTLTGAYNRRYINEKLPVDIMNAVLGESGLSLIMADIDHFKMVNDTFGHLTGDAVIKEFNQTLHRTLKRDSDWIARFGGEEFLVCLPGASHQKAAEIAERMRTAVEDTQIAYRDRSIQITASFGVYTVPRIMGYRMDDLIEQADQKMYEAKRAGRNRVAV